jgi:hypothetical protein
LDVVTRVALSGDGYRFFLSLGSGTFSVYNFNHMAFAQLEEKRDAFDLQASLDGESALMLSQWGILAPQVYTGEIDSFLAGCHSWGGYPLVFSVGGIEIITNDKIPEAAVFTMALAAYGELILSSDSHMVNNETTVTSTAAVFQR